MASNMGDNETIIFDQVRVIFRKNIKIPFANPYGMQNHKYYKIKNLAFEKTRSF